MKGGECSGQHAGARRGGSSPFFTPRYNALLLGGIFSSAVMSSFRYLRHASHWLLLMGGEEEGNARLVGDELGPVCSAQEAGEHVVEERLERVAAGEGVCMAAGAKRQRGGAAHA